MFTKTEETFTQFKNDYGPTRKLVLADANADYKLIILSTPLSDKSTIHIAHVQNDPADTDWDELKKAVATPEIIVKSDDDTGELKTVTCFLPSLCLTADKTNALTALAARLQKNLTLLQFALDKFNTGFYDRKDD